jgi:arginase family enzyme
VEALETFGFFGAALDPDEGLDSIQRKITYLLSGKRSEFEDPYDGLTKTLSNLLTSPSFVKHGKIDVESWLTPKPKKEDLEAGLIDPMHFSIFLDGDGCREYSDKIEKYVSENIKEIPVMIGVDHSLSGGVIKALAKRHGKENLCIIMLDAHFDAIPSSIRNDMIAYCRENETFRPYGFSFLDYTFSPTGRPESYNAGSFILYLIQENVILPENLVMVGVVDYPDPRTRAIADKRVKRFVDLYLGMENNGVTFVTKGDIENKGVETSLTEKLEQIKNPYIYISLDIDIGARSAIYGARFLDIKGLNECQIYQIAMALRKKIENSHLAGLDVMETDVYSAGGKIDGRMDRTYQVEANFIRSLLGFNMTLDPRESELLKSLAENELAVYQLHPKDKPIMESLVELGFAKKIGKKYKISECGHKITAKIK